MYRAINVSLTPQESTISLVEETLDDLLLTDLCNLCVMYMVPFVYSFSLTELPTTCGVANSNEDDQKLLVSKVTLKLEQSNCICETDPLDNVQCCVEKFLLTLLDSTYFSCLRELYHNNRISKYTHSKTNNAHNPTTWCIDLPVTQVITSVFSCSPAMIKTITGVISSSPPKLHLNIATVSPVKNVELFLDVLVKTNHSDGKFMTSNSIASTKSRD